MFGSPARPAGLSPPISDSCGPCMQLVHRPDPGRAASVLAHWAVVSLSERRKLVARMGRAYEEVMEGFSGCVL